MQKKKSSFGSILIKLLCFKARTNINRNYRIIKVEMKFLTCSNCASMIFVYFCIWNKTLRVHIKYAPISFAIKRVYEDDCLLEKL